jgi:hypothetical protein
MRCDDYKILFMDFLYNELSADDEVRLKEHLKICESCRQEYEEMSKTSVLLRGWPDEDPGASLVFVNQPAGFLSRLRHLVWPAHEPLGKKLLGGFAVASVAVLLLAALLNFELTKKGDDMNLRLSVLPRSEIRQDIDSTIIKQLREQNLELINQVMLANREQQRQEMARNLAQFAQEVHRQRQNDLLLVGRGLEQAQEWNDSRFQQTNEVLNSLIRTTTYQPQQ